MKASGKSGIGGATRKAPKVQAKTLGPAPKRRKPIRGMIDSKAQKRNYAVNLHPHVWYPSEPAKATGRNNKGGRAVVRALRRTGEKGDT